MLSKATFKHRQAKLIAWGDKCGEKQFYEGISWDVFWSDDKEHSLKYSRVCSAEAGIAKFLRNR